MVQIIQRREDPSVRIGQQLGGIVQAGVEGYEKGKDLKNKEQDRLSLESQYGIKLSTNPEIAKLQVAAAEKSRQKQSEFDRRLNIWNMGEDNSNADKKNGMTLSDTSQEDYNPSLEMNLDEIDTPTKKTPQKKFKPPFSQKQIMLADPADARIMNDQNASAERTFFKEKQMQTDQELHKEKIYNENRDFYYKNTKEAIDEADKVIKNAPKIENNLRNLKVSILSGDLSGIKSYLIDKLGWEPAKTENMALFANATKDLLVESLSDIPGGRPNQFLERFLSQGLPAIGRPEVANMALYETKKFNEDLNLERARIKRRLYDEDLEKGNFSSPGSLNSRTNKELLNYAADRQEKIAYDLQSLVEKEMSDAELIEKVINKDFMEGSPLTPRTAKIINHMVNGGTPYNAMNDAQKSAYINKIQELGLVPNKYGVGNQ